MNVSDFAGAAKQVDMASVAQKVSSDIKEYLIIAQQEQTKRAQIKADCKVELAKIEAMRSSLEKFLDRSFEERRKNFEELFSVIRRSMDSGDLQSLERSLSVVVELAQISPLAEAKSLASLRSAMDDPDHEFQL
jgi:hypothetical protein